MGQKRDRKVSFVDSGSRFPSATGTLVADIFEKAPQEQAAGQTTPQVGNDLVQSIVSNRSGLEQEDVEPEMRMAADIFDSELAKSLALESSKTKYGPGQLSKSPASRSYLGHASYPAS
tara:strand:- start:535 stop:888 length:354 start_codon:yes stop_codon:yes gene_type:complete